MPAARALDRKGIPNSALVAQVEENPAWEDGLEGAEEIDAITELDGTPSDHLQSPLPSPDLTRNESTTTATSSSGHRSLAGSRPPRLASFVYENKAEECFPEPVIVAERERPRYSSHDFEKSYPEVVVGPVTSIHEDNTSMFSESGSMPVTTR